MTACQVPPPSPLTSYWITAFVPLALSDRKRPAIASNVSFTVGMGVLLCGCLEREQIHPTGDRQHRAGDVAGALGAEKSDRRGDVLRLSLLLHRHALDHALVHRAQAGVRGDDAGRHGVTRDVV